MGRYKVEIRTRGKKNLLNKQHDKNQGQDAHDQDVYLAPHHLKNDDELFLKQAFWIW